MIEFNIRYDTGLLEQQINHLSEAEQDAIYARLDAGEPLSEVFAVSHTRQDGDTTVVSLCLRQEDPIST